MVLVERLLNVSGLGNLLGLVMDCVDCGTTLGNLGFARYLIYIKVVLTIYIGILAYLARH